MLRNIGLIMLSHVFLCLSNVSFNAFVRIIIVIVIIIIIISGNAAAFTVQA